MIRNIKILVALSIKHKIWMKQREKWKNSKDIRIMLNVKTKVRVKRRLKRMYLKDVKELVIVNKIP